MERNIKLANMTVKEILERQIPWSTETFGEGKRTAGITEHIAKELDEIRAEPDDLMEWVDVILLSLDGAWRAGYTAEEVQHAIQAKQNYNMQRIWPKFNKGEVPDKAIEHVRDDQCQVKVAGAPFHCNCGGNVFTKRTDSLVGLVYSCNSCFREYAGETIGGCDARHTPVVNYCNRCKDWTRDHGYSHWTHLEFLRAGGVIDFDNRIDNKHKVLTPGILTQESGCTCGVTSYSTKFLTFRNEAKCCKCGQVLKGIVNIASREFYCAEHTPLQNKEDL